MSKHNKANLIRLENKILRKYKKGLRSWETKNAYRQNYNGWQRDNKYDPGYGD